MKITVIGDGNAFSDNNSCFYIETNPGLTINNNILFDCGFTVFLKLKNEYPKILEELDAVFISHMDDDHIGSLRTLLYYRYFVLNKSTKIIIGDDSMQNVVVDYLYGVNKEVIGGVKEYAKIYTLMSVSKFNSNVDSKLYLQGIYVNHLQDCYGLKITYLDKLLFISGDTKASSVIEGKVFGVLNINKKKHLVFHDYSEFNYPSRQTHACDNDIEIEYSEEFQDCMIKYHYDNAKILGNIYEI